MNIISFHMRFIKIKFEFIRIHFCRDAFPVNLTITLMNIVKITRNISGPRKETKYGFESLI